VSAGRERVGLFGGSFDPIHRGHIEPVQDARQALRLDRVLFLPTAQPPHKPGRALAPPLARFAMAELALLGEEGLYVSGHELTPGQPAFTVETVRHFRGSLPEAELFLLIGGDSFHELVLWRNWREIVAAIELVVLARPGFDIEHGLTLELRTLLSSERVHVLQRRAVEASSTQVRECLRRGEDVPSGWLPPLVLNYIRKYRLYR
jgi:nicotinate-nucleotide adenylyltransferase